MNRDEQGIGYWIRRVNNAVTVMLILGDLVIALYQMYEAVDRGEGEWIIPILLGAVGVGAVIFLFYLLVCGFAQMADDIHALRNGKEKPVIAQMTDPIVSASPPSATVRENAVHRVRCAACGNVTAVFENGICEHCGKTAFSTSKEHAQTDGPLYPSENQNGPAPFGMWRCARCGGFTAKKEKVCRCGYKRQ